MGTFELTRRVQADPAQVWRVVTDWGAMSRWMPLTEIRQDAGPTRVGWGFAAVTGIGPLRFSDTMILTDWAPPAEAGRGSLRLIKTGRLLAGWAVVGVEPADGGATLLIWREDITVRPVVLGRLVAPVVDALSRRLFARALDAMSHEAAQQAAQKAAQARQGTGG